MTAMSRDDVPRRLARRRFLTIGGATAISLLAACAPSSPQPPSQPAPKTDAKPPAAPTSAPAIKTEPKPADAAKPSAKAPEKPAAAGQQADARYGGQVTIPLNGTPKLLNPMLRSEVSSFIVNWSIFDSLVVPDPQTLENRPQMATKWEISPDKKSWTFSLKPGITWHDGQPFTSADVKYTFETILKPDTNTGFRPNLATVASIDTPDPLTVRFTLKQPDSSFLATMQIPIVPKHRLDGKDPNTDEFNQSPIGTGAFKLKEYSAATHVLVEANPDFHGGRPFLDRIVFKVIPDVNVRVAQMKTGELDVIDAVEAVHLKDLQQNPGLQVYKMDQTNVYGFFWNVQKPPFNDLKVRQAINYAMDRQAIVDKVLEGLGAPAGSAFPKAFGWAYKDIPVYPYDPQKAKALLAEAGWTPGAGGILHKDGQPFRFQLVGDKGSPTRERIVSLGQQYLKELGMDVSIQFVEWNQFLEKYQWSHDKEMTFLWNAYNPPLDPDGLSRRWASTSQPRENQTNFSNPRVDELFLKAKEAQEQRERQAAYFEIQDIIHAETPMALLYYPVEVAVAKAKLAGIIPAPFRIYHNMEKWHWEQ